MPNTATKTELLNCIDKDAEEAVKALRQATVSSRDLFELYEDNPSEKLFHFIALFPESPAELLETLYQNHREQKTIVEKLASHPRLATHIMQDIAEQDDEDTCLSLASNKVLSPKACEKLVNSDSVLVRCQLAINNALSQRLQTTLALDESPLVRQSLARRKNLDTVICRQFLVDSSPLVTITYLATASLEEEELMQFADSDISIFQNSLLLRTKLSERILTSLRLAGDIRIARRALEEGTISDIELWGLCFEDRPRLQADIAARIELPETLQALISRDCDASVKAILAANEAISSEAIDILIAENKLDLQLILLANEGQQKKLTRLKLCSSSHEEILLRIAVCADLSKEEIIALFNTRKPAVFYQLSRSSYQLPELSASLASILAREKLPSLRRLAAAAYSLPEQFWQELATDPAPMVRLAVAANLYCPSAYLLKLLEDTDAKVRQQAEISQTSRQQISNPAATP